MRITGAVAAWILVMFITSRAMASIPLIFIPGLKGSELTHTSGKTVWLTGWQALGLSVPDLSLPLVWEGDTQEKDAVFSTGPMKEVTIIPGLFTTSVYGIWLKEAAKLGRPFYAFHYDWRRDNLETLRKFEAYVAEISAQHPGVRPALVAHSMGGLIAFAALNRHPELFSAATFVGTPFGAGVSFLEDLHKGTPNGLNKKILSPKVLATFPSVYSFFPQGGDRVLDKEGKPLSVDFYSFDDWARYGLGNFSMPASDRLPEVFLTRLLKRAKEFRALLKPGRGPFPPITVIVGNQHPTFARVMRDGPHAVRGWDFESAPREPGDGRVLAIDQLLPAGVPGSIIYSDREHTDLLNDPKVIESFQPGDSR